MTGVLLLDLTLLLVFLLPVEDPFCLKSIELRGGTRQATKRGGHGTGGGGQRTRAVRCKHIRLGSRRLHGSLPHAISGSWRVLSPGCDDAPACSAGLPPCLGCPVARSAPPVTTEDDVYKLPCRNAVAEADAGRPASRLGVRLQASKSACCRQGRPACNTKTLAVRCCRRSWN